MPSNPASVDVDQLTPAPRWAIRTFVAGLGLAFVLLLAGAWWAGQALYTCERTTVARTDSLDRDFTVRVVEQQGNCAIPDSQGQSGGGRARGSLLRSRHSTVVILRDNTMIGEPVGEGQRGPIERTNESVVFAMRGAENLRANWLDNRRLLVTLTYPKRISGHTRQTESNGVEIRYDVTGSR
jgi:hypothetical protein